jgi:bifunctional non-homologous end joining protein LigD
MPLTLPIGAIPAGVPGDVRLQIVTPCKKPPSGDGWLHEIKHDGHRLVAIIPGDGQLILRSRNGYDRTRVFREPFRRLIEVKLPPMVLDGEIAVPDDRGVTHLDAMRLAKGSRTGLPTSRSICCTSIAMISGAARSKTARCYCGI